jgi:hypothetical protein
VVGSSTHAPADGGAEGGEGEHSTAFGAEEMAQFSCIQRDSEEKWVSELEVIPWS